MKQTIMASLAVVILFASCKKDPETPAVTTLSGTKTLSVNFSSTAAYTYFRFSDSAVLTTTDSATNKWDFALRLTTFLVNSNTSGPGNAAVILKSSTTFDAEKTAPTTNYAFDTATTKRAIKDGSWYTYNPTTHAFTPIAGQVFIFKTADGAHYAKMELLSVDYAPFVGPTPTTLLYKFRYTYQASGSITF